MDDNCHIQNNIFLERVKIYELGWAAAGLSIPKPANTTASPNARLFSCSTSLRLKKVQKCFHQRFINQINYLLLTKASVAIFSCVFNWPSLISWRVYSLKVLWTESGMIQRHTSIMLSPFSLFIAPSSEASKAGSNMAR